MVKIEFITGSLAFHEATHESFRMEASRILRKIADDFESVQLLDDYPIVDSYGLAIGTMTITED